MLPSNTTHANTPSSFITTLQTPLIFEEHRDWRVALIELNFKNALKTIYNDKIEVKGYVNRTKKNKALTTFVHGDALLNMGSETFPHSNMYLPGVDEAVTNLYSWVVHESGNVILKSKPADAGEEPEFLFKYQYGKVFLESFSDCVMNVNIPMHMAITFGFARQKDKYFIDFKERHTIVKVHKGLVEASYKPLVNVKSKDVKHLAVFYISTETASDMSSYSVTYEPFKRKETILSIIPKGGKYTNPEELAEQFVDAEFNKYFKLEYNESRNKFTLLAVQQEEKTEIHFLGGLNDVLGFKENNYTNGINRKEADLHVDLERGITNIFVYCDLCEPIRVGNASAPLLRSLAFNGYKHGEMVHTHYTTPMYIPINKSFIDTIEVRLCDAAGQIIGFVEGITTLILHLKRV